MKKNNKKDFIYNKNSAKSAVRTQKQSTLKDKLNKILFWVIIGAFCLFSVGSIMGILAFRNDDYKVHADSVAEQYIFYGSNTWLYSYYFLMSDLVPRNTVNSPYNVRYSFSTLQPELGASQYIRFIFSACYNGYDADSLLSLYNAETFQVYNPGDTSLTDEVQVTIKYGGLGVSETTGYYLAVPDGYPYAFNCTYFNIVVTTTEDSLFTANISQVRQGNSKMYDGFFKGKTYSVRPADYYNYIRYIDVNGCSVEFQFPLNCSSAFTDSFLLKSRTYYLSNDFDNNEFYQQGLYDGIQQGRQEGITIGEEQAVNKYKEQWLQQGRQEGIASANHYTFLGLISAAVDAPLQALMGLLNFEILGINFFGLFGGLLTLAIILFILRVVI